MYPCFDDKTGVHNGVMYPTFEMSSKSRLKTAFRSFATNFRSIFRSISRGKTTSKRGPEPSTARKTTSIGIQREFRPSVAPKTNAKTTKNHVPAPWRSGPRGREAKSQKSRSRVDESATFAKMARPPRRRNDGENLPGGPLKRRAVPCRLSRRFRRRKGRQKRPKNGRKRDKKATRKKRRKKRRTMTPHYT